MRFNFLRRWVPGAMLLVAAGASSALTLGRAQGVALIGRPLEVGLQIGLDNPSEANDLCPEAEVFYGENRVDARRVDLRSVPAGDAVAVRVRVAAPVDEAYVTVYLRVGCNQKLTRRYVLLSEQPGDLAEAAAQPTPVAPPVASAVPVPPAAPAGGGGAVGRIESQGASRAVAPLAAAAPTPTPRPAVRRPAPAPKPVAAPAPAPAPAAAEQRPRLKLEALEVRPRLAASAVRPGEAAALAAAAAASAQSRALNAAAEELQKNAERIQSMESDLKILREGMLKRDAALTELRDRLEKAEHERYANGVVYGLGALLVGALGLILVLWRRSRQVARGEWWGESHQPPAAVSRPADEKLVEDPLVRAAPEVPAPAAPEPAAPVASSAPVVAAPAPAPSPVSVRMSLPMGLSAPMGLASRRAVTDAEGLRVSDPLPLTSDELSDIQQEADFFVSLGEFDRAIEVLRNHIEAHPQASPIAWLDLLEIHHKLGRQEEYEQLRRDFEWLFNAKAPAFTSFPEDQDGLDAFPRLSARIQAAWPGRRVLQVIDDAIFRRPGTDGEESLSLQAYRDLLFLHNVASEMAAGDGDPMSPGAAGAGVEVDVDLDQLTADAHETQPAPMVIPQSLVDEPLHGNSVEFDLDPVAGFKDLQGQRPPANG